ncbi:MAG: hypothetical protein IJ223_07635 [Clostridia bacterium]|nr:hypothetical protein [Clostridia bacterium]
MDSQKKKIILIGGIAAAVLVLLIIVFIIIANSSTPKQPTTPAPEPEVEEVEVSLEETQTIKDYLKRYAYVAILARDTTKPNITHETMSSDLAMIYMSTQNVEKSTQESVQASNDQTALNAEEGDNRLSMEIDNTDTTNTVTDFPTAQTETNVFGLPAEEIQNAVFEMFGNNIDNLTQILMTETKAKELSEVYIKDIQDITNTNGVYNIKFDACLQTPQEKKAGINVYGLESYTIQVKLEKNENPKYNEYKMTTVDVVSELTPMAYHISYSDGKYGVIDNNGNVIIDNTYANVIIPNNYVGLFICYTDANSVPLFLNERGVQQFKEYDSVEMITANGSEGIKWNENNIILVEKDGYYGAVNYMGNTIFDVEYEEIVPLGYFPEY